MKILKLTISILYFYCSFSWAEKYSKFLGEFTDPISNKNYLILRKLKANQYLILDPVNLKTQTRVLAASQVTKRTWKDLEKGFKSTPYIRLRAAAKNQKPTKPYFSSGLRNTGGNHHVIITTDLCPTSKPLNYPLYEAIAKHTLQNGNPQPIGVAISGKWIKRHAKDLQWLKRMEISKQLSITWINHSYNHRYVRGITLKDNFMLYKGTDVKKEILETEKILLKNDLAISVFFRFPGLVSNQTLYNSVLDYGLIPLGSDSWIAKNQLPKNGSIILVHGNGNERIGVQKLRRWMKSRKNTFKAKSLSDAFINQFQ